MSGKKDSAKTLNELQRDLPWGAHDYTREFNARTDALRDFEHAYGHVQNALGGVFVHVIDAHAHTGNVNRTEAAKKLADLVICTLRMANTLAGGAIPMGEAVEDRLREKFPRRDEAPRAPDPRSAPSRGNSRPAEQREREDRPPSIRVGNTVDYHMIISGPVTEPEMVVRAGPQWMSDHWSVWLEGKAGCVTVRACTPPPAPPTTLDEAHKQLDAAQKAVEFSAEQIKAAEGFLGKKNGDEWNADWTKKLARQKEIHAKLEARREAAKRAVYAFAEDLKGAPRRTRPHEEKRHG